MSCIIGLVDGSRVWMGADSAGVADWNLVIRADPKIFLLQSKALKSSSDILVGFTSSYRMGQILRYQFEVPHHPAEMDTHEYMVRYFVEAARKCFEESGYGKKGGDEGDVGGHFLVGYQGRLFHIQGDYQIAETVAGFYSVGCGAAYAIGVLDATRGEIYAPARRITMALQAAEGWSAGVRGPFHILHTGDED